MHSTPNYLSKHTVAHYLWLFMVIVLVIGVFFFRFYRLPEYLMFLSDQGRDAIVLKRLVTLEKLVFVGPTTSIGNVFTGPFYYYLVAPFMLLSGLHPVGPALGIAFMNSFGVVGAFWFVVRRFGRNVGLIFLTLAGLSATQIWQSRYSWNPNPVPLFTFLTLVIWHIAIQQRRLRYVLIAGICFGLSLQLHYITIIILAPILFSLIPQVRNIRDMIIRMLTFACGSVATFAPLIVFEIKNHFVNTQTFFHAFAASEVQARNSVYIDRLRDTCAGLLRNVLAIEVNRDLSLYIVLGSMAVALYCVKKDKGKGSAFILYSLLTIGANILALSLLETGRHVHYYNPSYWLVYLIIAYLIVSIIKSVRVYLGDGGFSRIVLVTSVLFTLFWLHNYVQTQIQTLYFLTEKPKTDTQITHAQRVARYIISQTKSDQFQVVGLPFYETEGHYRYFLEFYNHRPMPADALGDPKELFVICHELNKPDCDIPGNPQWQIADFQNRHKSWRVASMRLVEEVRVFKLVY